jgi:hypothetical protein
MVEETSHSSARPRLCAKGETAEIRFRGDELTDHDPPLDHRSAAIDIPIDKKWLQAACQPSIDPYCDFALLQLVVKYSTDARPSHTNEYADDIFRHRIRAQQMPKLRASCGACADLPIRRQRTLHNRLIIRDKGSVFTTDAVY